MLHVNVMALKKKKGSYLKLNHLSKSTHNMRMLSDWPYLNHQERYKIQNLDVWNHHGLLFQHTVSCPWQEIWVAVPLDKQ